MSSSSVEFRNPFWVYLLLIPSLLLLRSNGSRQHSKVLYRCGGRRRGKRKTRESRREEKVVGFRSAFVFLTRKRETVTQGGTTGIDQLTRRRTQGAGIVKGWKEKRDRGRMPDTFT